MRWENGRTVIVCWLSEAEENLSRVAAGVTHERNGNVGLPGEEVLATIQNDQM